MQSANVTFNGLVTSDAGSSLSISGSTVNLAHDLSTANMAAVSLSNSTVNCPGIVFQRRGNHAGRNEMPCSTRSGESGGRWSCRATSNFINGALTTDAGSIIDILEGNTDGDANLTVANAFINSGLIDLSETSLNGEYSSRLIVNTGTLVNDVGGTIKSTQLGGDLYGSRVLAATVENRGTMSLSNATTVGSTHTSFVNNGTLAVMPGNVFLDGGSTFTNNGEIDLDASGISANLIINSNGDGALLNHGTIKALSSTGSSIQGALDNFGTVTVANGKLLLSAPVLSNPLTGTVVVNGQQQTVNAQDINERTGTISLSNGGRLEIDLPGAGYYAINDGIINVPGATTVYLDPGTFDDSQGNDFGRRQSGVEWALPQRSTPNFNLSSITGSNSSITSTAPLAIAAGQTFDARQYVR